MKINEYNQMMSYLTRPPSPYNKEERKQIVKDFYKKAEQPKPKAMGIVPYIKKMNFLYANGEDPKEIDPKEMEDIKKTLPVSEMVKKKKKPAWKYESWSDGIEKLEKEKKLVAGIKDSALYKLLENPKVLGVELGHDTIMQVINLIQGSGIVKKPKKESIKVAVVEKPEEKIDHIGFLESLRS